MFKKVIILILTAFCLNGFSQIYPSRVTTSLLQPYTIFLDEYTNPLLPKIKANVVFTDFTEPSWNIYLKLKITGPNFSIETNPNIKPQQAVNVIPGVPFEISGADLDWYFNNNNLIFSGISRSVLEANNNRLPEGFYTYCFEVMDYETNKKISLPNCASAYLALNDPPIVLAPTCGNAIENLNQQNILFQWQISNTNGNLNVSSLSYQIDLYEVNNSTSNPQMAIINNQALPIWQSQPIAQNSYLYGAAEPPLEKGKRYVYTIKAIEQGKSQIKNNGYSQACWFHYGYPENGNINLIALPNNHQFGLTDNGYFTWSRPDNVINNSQMVGYQFQIAPLLDGQDEQTAILNNTPFFQYYLPPSTSNPKNMALPTQDMMRLARMKPYVWQVKGISGQQEVAKSPIYKFTGPPIIENFFAGGFLVTVTNLYSFDSLTYKVSGKGKVALNTQGQSPEFEFKNVYLNPIGNNTWVMASGSIKDKIIVNPYVLASDSVLANKNAEFVVDSIYIGLDNLFLRGFVNWKFPLGVTGNTIPYINGKKQYLILDNDFSLYSQNYNSLEQNYTLNLLEPGGFTMNLDNTSQVYVSASKFNLKFNGTIDLPQSVKDGANTRVRLPFSDVGQLFFIKQSNINTSEAIRLVNNTNMDLKPRDYVFDFSERKSEGDFASDSTWKGLYLSNAQLIIPTNSEGSGQISASGVLNEPVLNVSNDSTAMFVNQNGLTLSTKVAYNPSSDTLKFNTFTTYQNEFKIAISNNYVNLSHLTGKIRIPVLDTLGGFPYFIKLDEFGFGNGYLINALNNYSFTFNPAGGSEQTINAVLTRAVFKNNNRLEMDLNIVWPHFSLSLNQLQKFCAWGSGNIGFETPNGILPLSYQATGKASGYDIHVDRIGCGRVANVYSFGISSRIIMADDIAGENGAPIVNAYSMYKNPLLSGDVSTMSFTMGNDTTSLDSNGVNTNVANDLNTNLNQTLNDLGANGANGGNGGNSNVNGGNNSNNSNAIIPNSVYMDMQKIVTMAETFVQFIDSVNRPKAQDYITVVKQILNSDAVKKLVNTSPEQLVNDLIMQAADAVVAKINKPIQNLSNKATSKIRTTINDEIILPVTSRIDTLIGKAMDGIKDAINDRFDDDQQDVKDAVTAVCNSVKVNLSNEIRNAINGSIETNVTSKITGFIEIGITSKITGFVRNEVRTVATNIIETGLGNSVNLNNILQNAEVLFKDVGDTIADAIKSINFNTIKNTAENVGNDIVKNIKFERISQNILTQLANSAFSAAIKGLIQNQLGNLGGAGGGIAEAILSTVKFDFTNIGDKLKNGQLDQIVKFDFTNIYIKTKAAEIKGQLKFTKDDPIYGDSFQAFVYAKVFVPKEDKPITGSLKFINGKTTQGSKFAYWFFGGELLGLNLKLGSSPFTIDGFNGMVYHKMKKMGNPTPLPDSTVNYGVRAGIVMFDSPTSGKIIKFDVGIGVEFGSGNFAIQLDGSADIGNFNGFSVATATGYIGYYSADKRFQGAFGVNFNTSPLLCAGGEMGVKVDGKNHTWEVYIGKRLTPIQAKLLCKETLKAGGYFDMKNTGIEAGFFINVDVEAQSPWIGGENLRIRGWANFGFGIDAYTNVTFEPSFKIQDAYISAWVSAGIGFDYETKVNTGSVTIAGVSLSGSLLYKNHQVAEIHGDMNGSVTILNCSFGVNMGIHYDIDNKQKIAG
jgi:hypothetical protein